MASGWLSGQNRTSRGCACQHSTWDIVYQLWYSIRSVKWRMQIKTEMWQLKYAHKIVERRQQLLSLSYHFSTATELISYVPHPQPGSQNTTSIVSSHGHCTSVSSLRLTPWTFFFFFLLCKSLWSHPVLHPSCLPKT